MTPIKRNTNYFIRSNGLLRIRISWNRLRYEISLGIYIDKVDAKGKPKWNGRRCRNSTTHGQDSRTAYSINSELQDIEDKIDDVFYKFEVKDRIPTVQEFKDLYFGNITDIDKIVTVQSAFDDFLKEGVTINQWANNTYKKFKTIKKLLMKFKPDMEFKDINQDFMKDLMAFQTNNAVHDISLNEISSGKKIVKYKGLYQNDTINRNMRLVKWFFKWCYEKGYIDNLNFKEVKASYKTPKKPIIFLEWNELMAVYNLDLSARPELAKTRDMFCFCCFTSLRYSDMINLRWGSVTMENITITTIKTTDTIVIDLNDYSREILLKYYTPNSRPEDTVFQEKSSQKMNKRLKEIAKMCGIDTPITMVQMTGAKRTDITVPKYEMISTHCGRRTFISNAISLGVPPHVVMKWTGHSDYKAMQPYIDIADKSRKQAMNVFNKNK